MHVNVKDLCRHQKAKLTKKEWKSGWTGPRDIASLLSLAAKTDGQNGAGRASRTTLDLGCLLWGHTPFRRNPRRSSLGPYPTYLLAFRSFLPPGVLFPDTQHPVLLSQTLLEQKHRLLPTYAWVILQERTVTTSHLRVSGTQHLESLVYFPLILCRAVNVIKVPYLSEWKKNSQLKLHRYRISNTGCESNFHGSLMNQ